MPWAWRELRRCCGGGELYVVHSVRTGALWLSALCSGHGRHLRPGCHLLYAFAHLRRIWSGRCGRSRKTKKEEEGGLVFFLVPWLLKCCVFYLLNTWLLLLFILFRSRIVSCWEQLVMKIWQSNPGLPQMQRKYTERRQYKIIQSKQEFAAIVNPSEASSPSKCWFLSWDVPAFDFIKFTNIAFF